MKKTELPALSIRQKILMVSRYVREKIVSQARAVFFVVAYLFLIQIMVLQLPVKDSLAVSLGIGLVIIGLALFLEGLFLGIMPLGELCGLKLPVKTGLFFILFFTFFLGITATLAEPAIAVLQGLGDTLHAWETPLLYSMLNRHAYILVLSVAAGVGTAVMLGVLRFIKNWSLKPIIAVIIPVVLGLSIYGFFDENVRHVTALAWDCGGITTGPVTVPLIIALGIGITRATGGSEQGISGLGVVTLASAIPVATVLITSIIIGASVPGPMPRESFFHHSNIEKAGILFENHDKYIEYAVRHQTPEEIVKNQFDGDQDGYISFVSDAEVIANTPMPPVLSGLASSLRAVVPLSLLLILLTLLLKERIPFIDEKILGIIFAAAGFFLFNSGMESGLSRLGMQSGKTLPAAFTSVYFPGEETVIKGFDISEVKTAYDSRGVKVEYFMMKVNNDFREVTFHRDRYNPETGTYTHIPEKGPLFGDDRRSAGIAVFLVLAFFLGFGATLAEPALNALGITLEEISIGTFHKGFLVKTVAAGVGAGLIFGMIRIIWNIPIIFLLLPPYAVSIILTFFSSEEFVNIAWDCGGVTTGPVTVPLVIALGIGVGEQAGTGVESFGILALASIFPILAVLSSGIAKKKKKKRGVTPELSDG